jgi:Ca2+-binding EF-hand superfamily protein
MHGIASIVALASLVSLMATAEERPETPKDVEVTFESLDRDKDEHISKAEAAREQTLQKRFASVDSDADGKLTKEEYRARPSTERFE